MTAPTTDSDGVAERPTSWIDGPPSRHDLVLAVIPPAFVLAVVAGEIGRLPLHDALFGASLFAAAAVADALFVNPPRDPT